VESAVKHLSQPPPMSVMDAGRMFFPEQLDYLEVFPCGHLMKAVSWRRRDDGTAEITWYPLDEKQDISLIGSEVVQSNYYLLSITDPHIAAQIPESRKRPGGHSWLGGAYVAADNAAEAAQVGQRLVGRDDVEVLVAGPIPATAVLSIYRDRLLTSVEDMERAGATARLDDIEAARHHDSHRLD